MGFIFYNHSHYFDLLYRLLLLYKFDFGRKQNILFITQFSTLNQYKFLNFSILSLFSIISLIISYEIPNDKFGIWIPLPKEIFS